MGKAKRDGSTPEQPTAIGRLALTPEQRAAFQRMMAEKFEQAARLDKAAKAIDRAIAIRDGLIPPPWAEQLLKLASQPKAEPKHTRKGRQMSRVRPLVRKMFPPDGIAPDDVKTWQAVREVQKKLPDVSRDVIERAIGRRKS